MRLTQFTDYSLRVLMYLAVHDGEPVTIQEVASAYDISKDHLMKVVSHLVRQGVVAATRGQGGGIRLAVPANRISIGGVVRAAEGDRPVVECVGDPARCRISPACRLAGVLDEAFDAFYDALDQTTLADLTGMRDPLRRLLQPPGIRQ